MPYTSDSWTFGHVPTTFKRLPTVNRWGVLHGFYSDQRDDQELSNSAPDMPSGVGFRILANRNIWRFPNILGTVSGIKFQKADPSTGAFEGDGIQFVEGINNSNPSQNQMYSWSRPNFSATRSSSIYGNSSTVHPDSLRFLALIRSY